jgi:PAS domain S-box-containing protein
MAVAPPAGMLAVAVIASVVLLRAGQGDQASEVQMRDLAGELAKDVRDLADRGSAKTRSLAADPRLLAVLREGRREEGEALANELLRQSLELDIVALFNGGGTLLAVSTLRHDGTTVPRTKIEQLYAGDYSQRGVVQSCLTSTATESSTEFQTSCDFTPPYFGSSGLSVAFSAPVLASGGERAGVVSTRLNFERVTDQLPQTSFVREGNRVHLVADDGRFFDEEVNSGRVPAPLTPEQVRSAMPGPQVQRMADEGVCVQRDGLLLMGVRVPLDGIASHGGISVLLQASEGWAAASSRRAVIAAGAALLGSLMAAGVWMMFMAARSRQQQAQTALAQERAGRAVLLDSLTEGVVGVDANGRITSANPAAAKLLGVQALSLVGQNVRGLLPEGEHGPLDRSWSRETLRLVSSTRREFPAQVAFSPLPGGRGGVLRFTDQTEHLETRRRLLDATRRAGMAEVATGVLHNVGNVLNSVNVAAGVVREKLHRSEVARLRQAADMMQTHANSLAEYLVKDAKGRHIPAYIVEATRLLASEHEAMSRELERLVQGIEHVKRVVASQQQYARGPAVEEQVAPAELCEEALALQDDALRGDGVTVVRDFMPCPPMKIDKHRAMQVLINLISNARQALAESNAAPRRLSITLGPVQGASGAGVSFEVRDNGVGISAENLCRVFNNGFTTKRDGHGFGLHSAANAAREMGGSLRAESDGPGLGACFTLELPVAGGVVGAVPRAMRSAA